MGRQARATFCEAYMPSNLLVVNADGPETRVALTENGTLAELMIERKRERGIVGNIYKGRVLRVLPGMQAAFVDLGVEKAAFLYVADVLGAGDIKSLFAEDIDDDREDRPQHQHRRIEELLKEGQETLCQVSKEPISTKGARVTSYVSLPGRHLVFMPTVDHVGISRRISTDKERKRLRDIVDSQRPKGSGFIVRTVADGASEKELRDDMDFLLKLWREVGRKAERTKPGSLIYPDLDLLLRTVRDSLTSDIEKMVIDSRPEYERVQKFVQAFMPEYQGRIHLYTGSDAIFDGYGIEQEIERALEKKVWLKSGGSLIIEQGEALTAIDVNTGKFVGKKNLEETITKNNLEACKTVADQLRLRNIGGIIVIDFVDMDKESNREKVWKAFDEALKADRARSNVSKISELGLVEMTRKRTRESLARKLTEPCFYCEGRGYLKSKTTLCYEILRELRRSGDSVKEDTVVVLCHPEIAQLLETVDKDYVIEMEKRLQKRVMVKGRASYHLEQYAILGKKAADSRGDGDEPRKKDKKDKKDRKDGREKADGEGDTETRSS